MGVLGKPDLDGMMSSTLTLDVSFVKEDTNQANESSQPLDNGKIITIDNDIVAECSVGLAQDDAYLLFEKAPSNVQGDPPKKSYTLVIGKLT